MAPKPPRKKPLGALHGLVSAAREGKAEAPQSELNAAKPQPAPEPKHDPPAR